MVQPPHEHIWEYLSGKDKLMTHELVTWGNEKGTTRCGRGVWTVNLPEDQEVWYGDHDRDDDDVLLCADCGTEADRT